MEKNWFITDSCANCFKNQFYFIFYKRFPLRVEVFRDFLQKEQFFLKMIDSFKESDRTYSFDMFPLFVLTSLDFLHQIFCCYFIFRIKVTYSYPFPLWFLIIFTVVSSPFYFFLHLSVLYVRALPCYCRKNHSFNIRSGKCPNKPKSTSMNSLKNESVLKSVSWHKWEANLPSDRR